MPQPDWQNQPLRDGLVREPSPDKQRLVVWLPRDGADGDWERVSSVPGAETTPQPGLHAAAAVSIRAKQRGGGVLGKLLGRFRAPTQGPAWVLPSGASADQVGERQTDLLLVWTEDDTLTDSLVEGLWPASARRERLGPNLFLVGGVAAPAPAAVPTAASVAQPSSAFASGGSGPTPPNPRADAERLLAAARAAGDRRREATALVDLGLIARRMNDAKAAVGHLEAASAIAREFGDQALESDVLGNLALAVLAARDPRRALPLIDEALSCARASGDRFQIKTALDAVGTAFAVLNIAPRSIPAFEEALALARELGDRTHEAELLRHLAIQHATVNDRDQAVACGRAAIDLYRQMGFPQVENLSSQVEKYAAGDDGAVLPASGPGVVVSGWAPAAGASGPGLLRMAFSAFESMVKFVGAGMKTVPPAQRAERLAVCGACEHHTGVRCKLCGCFTSVKTWLPHERCPIQKW